MIPDVFIHTFPNGLRLIHLQSDSPVSYCGFAINAGTRDEEPDESGLAHFVEHILFKGTAKRKAWHILNRMENVGGELNAYTAKEDTFVYSIFMEEHYGRAFELLTDIIFHSCFPQQEIEKEVDVILDEINTYKDTPSELIFDEFENLLFNGHALGRNILGDEESLMRFTSGSGLSFTRRFYVPSNMVFFSMGRTKPGKIIRLAEEAWSSDFPAITHRRTPPLPLPAQNKRECRDTHQTHVITGGRSYNMYECDKKRIPLFLLNNLLGGPGMNSRLNLSLREKNGLVYNVESNITSYTDTGFASIYFGTDPKHTEKAIRLVHKELNRLCDAKLSASQLSAIKKQVTGQLCIASDNKESLFLGLGKQFLHHNRYEPLSELFEKIEAVTAEDILEAANEVFLPARLSSLIYAK
ncbi:MAG: insulinase family protein [Tannerellaceae bacterium]|jgi:predicted Zn-dependent peptidase|nr:insulinase family protein [Tannerellaceae bacterium]